MASRTDAPRTTVYDDQGHAHAGRVLRASEHGSLVETMGRVIMFNAEGVSLDGTHCLCPESIPCAMPIDGEPS